MSVIGVSPGDVVKMVQLGLWLHDHCFDKINTAHAQYIQFGQTIHGLTGTLQTLLEQAEWQSNALNAYLGAFTQYQASAKSDFYQAVGNYEQTLVECRDLLTKNNAVKLESGFVRNVVWGAVIQGKVDILTKRVSDHNDRIRLLLEPFRGNQLQRMEAMLFGVFEIVNPAPELNLDCIPKSIINAMESCLESTLIEMGVTFDRLPRQTKYDALHKVWHGSTAQVSENADQTIEQHLNLLKTAYFITRLKEETAYENARPGFPYRRTILEIQKATVKQLERPDLTPFSEDSLKQLDPATYHIIPHSVPETPEIPIEENPWEEKILEVRLPDIPQYSSHTLSVYRNGPESLRVVREKIHGKTGAVNRDREGISIMSDLLIPFYAQPSATAFNLVSRSRTGAGNTPYEFANLTDVYSFQRAVTGYQVLSHFENVRFSFLRSGVHRHRSFTYPRCKLQIWRWRPLQSIAREKARRESNTSSVGSPASSTMQSQYSSSTMQSVTSGLDPSIVDSSLVSIFESGEKGQGGVIAAATILPFLLMVYADDGTALSFFATSMIPALQRSEKSCKCSSKPDKCTETVLKHQSGSFEARKFSTATSAMPGTPLDKWDMSVFSRPAGDSSKCHPDYNDKMVPPIGVDWINFGFDNVATRQKFDKHYRVASIERDKEQRQLDDFYRHVRYLVARPREAAAGGPTAPTSPPVGGAYVSSPRPPSTGNSSQSTIRPARGSTGSGYPTTTSWLAGKEASPAELETHAHSSPPRTTYIAPMQDSRALHQDTNIRQNAAQAPGSTAQQHHHCNCCGQRQAQQEPTPPATPTPAPNVSATPAQSRGLNLDFLNWQLPDD